MVELLLKLSKYLMDTDSFLDLFLLILCNITRIAWNIEKEKKLSQKYWQKIGVTKRASKVYNFLGSSISYVRKIFLVKAASYQSRLWDYVKFITTIDIKFIYVKLITAIVDGWET